MYIVTWPFITAVVYVTDQPKITARPQSKTTTEGNGVTLSCNATGNPKPTMSWTRNGSPVDTTNNSGFSFSEGKKQLTITNVNRTDSGEYQCVASNKLGNDKSNVATLDVQCKLYAKTEKCCTGFGPKDAFGLSKQKLVNYVIDV